MDKHQARELIRVSTHAGRTGGPVHDWLTDARPRIAAAARRGATEAAIPFAGSLAEFEAIRDALGRTGLTVTPVVGEDGPYSVVHW